jgi:hypothetical protein
MAANADILVRGRVDDQISKPLDRINAKINNTTKAGKDLSGQMRLMRGGAGQLGHQIQDVAVQLQMGTDAMIVFGQQGSQVAALFGPKGAMLGGILAVGAAVAGPLVKSLTQSNDILEELEKNARETTASLHDLSGAQRDVAEQVLRQREKELIDAVAQARKNLEAAEESQTRKSVTKTRGGVNQNAQALSEATENVDRYTRQLGLAEAELESVRESLSGVDKSLVESNKALELQIATYGMNDVAAAAYKAQLDGVITAEELLEIQLLSQLETLKALEEQREESRKRREADIKAAEDLAEAEADAFRILTEEQNKNFKEEEKNKNKKREQDKKLRREGIEAVGEQLMTLDSSNKKVFQMQKAYRIVEATMSAYQAANNALAAPFPFPIPQAMAAAAFTFGMANVAQIKAQSFEGGGFTGFGARAGGLDGKGGRIAMVHPNETIIDHNKGGSAGITVINNVDARGSGADVDQKIKSAMAQTSQQTIMTIQDLMRRRRLV